LEVFVGIVTESCGMGGWSGVWSGGLSGDRGVPKHTWVVLLPGEAHMSSTTLSCDAGGEVLATCFSGFLKKKIKIEGG